LDTIPPRELFDIFERVCLYVDLKGCETPEDVRQKVLQTLRLMQRAVDSAKRPSTRRKWLGKMKFLWTIIREESIPKTDLTTRRKYDLGVPNRRVGFQTAVINEAIENPDSLYNLTFDHGYSRAKTRMYKASLLNSYYMFINNVENNTYVSIFMC
jgi:hypothetical protein